MRTFFDGIAEEVLALYPGFRSHAVIFAERAR